MRQADALPTVLAGGYLCDDLGRNVAGGGETVGLINAGTADDRTVLEHIFQVDQVAVVHMLCEVVGVVEMDNAVLVCLYDILGKEQTVGDVTADLTRHIVALNAVDRGIFVGVFLLDFLVVTFDQGQNAVVGGIGTAFQESLVAVFDIVFSHVESTALHDLVLDEVLDLLNGEGAVHIFCIGVYESLDGPNVRLA